MACLFTIDDAPDILVLISAYLESAGHEVYSFESGRTAIEACSTLTPELIITDLFMPEMDGIELMKELKRLGQKCPILLMSGADLSNGAYSGTVMTAKKMGAEFLSKPFKKSVLLNMVSAILEAQYT